MPHKTIAATANARRAMLPWDPASRLRPASARSRRSALRARRRIAGFLDSGTRCIGDNIDTTRNLERELRIGQADVFLQLREGERRGSSLRVDGDKALDGESRRVDGEHQPIVVR